MQMAYKNLLVVLDEDERSHERLALAAGLAERFDAHLVGLYVSVGPEQPGAFEQFPGYMPLFRPIYAEIEARIRDQAEAMRVVFEDAVRRRSLSAEWRAATGYPANKATLHGRYEDLIILGQIDGSDPWSPLLHPLPQDVAMTAGRPVLVVPYAGHFEQVGQRVLVGWDGSREAARAISDAMPFLAVASIVTVIIVDPEDPTQQHGEVPGADIARHLARHGVVANVERTVSAGIGIGNTLLSRVSDFSADLLVMGAYGHSRARELLLGGATRTVLASATVPVLMAH
jgi:nucleotide-binding universal stress UspA family protein